MDIQKEFGFISWNNREPVYDIRARNHNHAEYGKGVALNAGERVLLKDWMRTESLGKQNYKLVFWEMILYYERKNERIF